MNCLRTEGVISILSILIVVNKQNTTNKKLFAAVRVASPGKTLYFLRLQQEG